MVRIIPRTLHDQSLKSVWLLPIVALLIIGSTLTWFAYDEKQQAIEHEFRALESNGRIAEAQIGGLLRNIEQLLNGVMQEQGHLSATRKASYDAVLAERMKQFPEIRSLVVINADGRVEQSATPQLKGFDSSKRDYFVAHLAGALKPNFYISRPFKTATGKDMSIAFSVAMHGQDKSLQGMVVSGVNPRFFESILSQIIPPGEGTAAVLFNRYGDVIYRVPEPDQFKDLSVASSAAFQEHFSTDQRITRHIGLSAIDGKKRISVIGRIGDTGLSVGVSREYDDVLMGWRRNIALRLFIFLLATAVTLGLAWIAQRRLQEVERAEASARREKHFSDDIIDSLPGVFFMLDSEGHLLRWNGNMLRSAQRVAERLNGKHVLELVPEAARKQFAAFVEQTFQLGGAEMEADFWAQAHAVTPYHFIGRRIRLEDSDYLIGLGSDISARKQAEEELQLAASIFHASSEGMVITDANTRIIAINPAFTRLTGYTIADLKGLTPAVFKSGRHDQGFYQAMWETLKTTGEWCGEIWDRNKDGQIVAKRLTINAIRAADGAINRYIALSSDISRQKEAEETIWRQANFDELSGLPNRRLFHDRLQQEIKKSDRNEQRLALLFIDLDNFKEVNDTRGHQLGDVLLQQAAQRIVTCVRDSDTVARLGGDEFTVVLSGVADMHDVERAAQAILQTLTRPFSLDAEDFYVSASIGITLYPEDAPNAETLIKNADQAMYAAKAAGKNRYGYFISALQESAQARQSLLRDLRGAVAAGQLSVYFQPIVELSTQHIHKAEALVRWRHPERGMISPMEFIPLAEETGLIQDIGDWVFRQACATAKHWQASYRGSKEIQISINKSPRQFANGKVDTSWIEYLGQVGLPASAVAVEITEGLLLDSRAEITDKLLQLRNSGIQISLDDFGTGYSAMAYLKKFPIDYLKIDKSFVCDMASDPSDQAIVEAIIVMAHKLGLKVIAEGVETEEQRVRLLAAGCDYAQGYLFARPMPDTEFLARVTS